MKKLFKRILCPVDIEDNLTAINLDLACDVAEGSDATVCLLHVESLPVSASGFSPLPVSESEDRAKLEKIAREHLDGKVKYEIHTKVDWDPAGAILKAEEELGVDSVIMATHGRKWLGRLILGSVAEKVVRESSCPVLVVRPMSASA
jgi:nucleotide-binding universal stress UspA family protein